MYVTVIIIAIIVSVLLALIVLIQNPKGGGIASNFSAGSQIIGVKRTNEFVEKATWTLIISLLVLCLSSNIFVGGTKSQDSILKQTLETEGVPAVEQPMGVPAAPGQPGQGQQTMPPQGQRPQGGQVPNAPGSVPPNPQPPRQ
jgi:preprotein translocase subunit SecG